jgi:hypothetical protein
MSENTLFRGVFSLTRWSSGSDVVTESETLPEHISSVYGAKKRDPRTLECVWLQLASMKNVIENKDVYGSEIPSHEEEGMWGEETW